MALDVEPLDHGRSLGNGPHVDVGAPPPALAPPRLPVVHEPTTAVGDTQYRVCRVSETRTVSTYVGTVAIVLDRKGRCCSELDESSLRVRCADRQQAAIHTERSAHGAVADVDRLALHPSQLAVPGIRERGMLHSPMSRAGQRKRFDDRFRS